MKINLCEIFGVEEGEVFGYEGYDSDNKIENNTLLVRTNGIWDGSFININTLKDLVVIKKPKFPKRESKYWFVYKDMDVVIDVTQDTWYDTTFDIINFKIGNYFETKEEAEANKDRIVEFLNDPTKLEW